jgi:threonyl-tRNA synthetase
VIAKINGELWDLDRPLEEDSQLQLLKFDDDEGTYKQYLCINILLI